MSATLEPLINAENGLYWNGWSSSSMEAWTQVILHGILCILSVILVFLFFWIFQCNHEFPCINAKRFRHEQDPSVISRHSIKSKKSKEFTINLRILLFFAILCTVLYNFIMYFGNVLMVLVFNIRFNQHCLYRVLCVVICGIQRTIAYVFMLVRFGRAFNGSLFAVTKLKLRMLIILIIIIFTSLEIVLIYAAYLLNSFECDISKSLFLFIMIFIFSLTDIIICISLTYIFLWRLRKITKMQNNDSVSLHMKRIVRKMSLLTIVMVLSTLIATVSASVVILPYQMYGLDSIINCMCLMLSFALLDFQYKKFCGCCIRICKICCMRQISNDITELKLNSLRTNTYPMNSSRAQTETETDQFN